MTERVHAICRSCAAMCPLVVDMDDGRPVSILGDKNNPVYHGYSCIKGREMVSQVQSPYRLYSSQRRRADGSFESISSATALDEIASKLADIIDRSGPRAVATYAGTFIFTYPATQPVSTAWMKAIGSEMMFTSATIDQPGKAIAAALHGNWCAGPQVFDESDTWLLVGVNPIVAKSGGVPNQNPAKRLKDAVERGMQVIVIDPRRTECAERAAVHLQLRPGEDPTVLAGMIRQVIADGLYDSEFVAANTEGFDGLKRAVEPFTPEYVAARAGVPAADLVAAARIYGGANKGGATAGTGPNMAPRGNLTEYLLLALMSICGRWQKRGERVPNPGALGPRFSPRAQAMPPYPAWGFGEKLRVRGFTNTAIGLPTSALADEILMPGDGQVKALIVIGGNPLMAWPDQRRTVEALRELELLVCLDIQNSPDNSCQFADYVVACRHSLESPAMTLPNELLSFFGPGFGYCEPYAQYSPAIVRPPADSDLIEEWEFFYGVAQRLGIELEIDVHYSWTVTTETPPKVKLDMVDKPTTDELYEKLCERSRVPLDEVKRYPGGHVFETEDVYVAPPEPGWAGRLQVGDEHMLAELGEVAAAAPDYALDTDYPFRLISRRMPDVFNSTGRSNPKQLRRYRYNPAFMNPADIGRLGLGAGDVVCIEGKYDRILGVVEAEEGVREGVISMSHCFGGLPDEDDRVREIGGNTGRLASVEHEYDRYTGIPRMSAIPVRISPAVG